MNWGTKIVIAFVLFVGLIATMVTISMRQDVSLVASDYYVQEIEYQDQIDRINNKNGLEHQPTIRIDRSTNQVKLANFGPVDGGEVHFFRPSKASLDKKYKLQLNEEGVQIFDGKDFEKGLWKVKINWKANKKAYYVEHTLVL